MLQHQPSRTAEYMAMFRASEHAKGAGRRVFTDPLAVGIVAGKPAAASQTARGTSRGRNAQRATSTGNGRAREPPASPARG